MLLLADENQHPVVVARLREAGHDVEWICETPPGATDRDILARTDIGTLILLTYDRDFGDLIFNRGHPAPGAIVYTRLDRVQPLAIADRLLNLLEASVAPGHMTTITRDGVRTKPFPLGAADA